MMRSNKSTFLLFLLTSLIFSACAGNWSIQVISLLHGEQVINKVLMSELEGYKNEGSVCEGIPLEIALYHLGFEVIEEIDMTDHKGEKYTLDEQDLINTVCLEEDGSVEFGENEVEVQVIDIVENEMVNSAYSIQDVTTTVASALGLDGEDLPGNVLTDERFDRVVMIFLDGFGYGTYQSAQEQGLIPNLSSDSIVHPAITAYPPRTTTGSATVLSGLPPDQHGVFKAGIRSTEAETLFDMAAGKGLKSAAIEGESLAFNLRNTEVVLSGDRDLNGGTDDNVFANAVSVLDSSAPDLLWIHFHGIDDIGHTYGANTEQVYEKISMIDNYVGQIIKMLPENTLIISFADHGMHTVKEEEKSGNHRNLIYDDMVIPIILKAK